MGLVFFKAVAFVPGLSGDLPFYYDILMQVL